MPFVDHCKRIFWGVGEDVVICSPRVDGIKASFVTTKTADETLSVSSPTSEYCSALNDPYLDNVASDEMSSHASTGAWVEGHDERLNMTSDESESHGSNSKTSCTEELDCNDFYHFRGVDFDMSVDFGESADLNMSNDFNGSQEFHLAQEFGRDRTLSTRSGINQ